MTKHTFTYSPFFLDRCYATLSPGSKNCRKKKCGHSNQVGVSSFHQTQREWFGSMYDSPFKKKTGISVLYVVLEKQNLGSHALSHTHSNFRPWSMFYSLILLCYVCFGLWRRARTVLVPQQKGSSQFSFNVLLLFIVWSNTQMYFSQLRRKKLGLFNNVFKPYIGWPTSWINCLGLISEY
jgi:hypothetical protein